MSGEVTAAWLRTVLARHDPLGAWPPAVAAGYDYRRAAEQAADDLHETLGLGHAYTVVADVLDREYPGLYQALEAGDPELVRRLRLVARAIWEHPARRLGQAVQGAHQQAPLSASLPVAPAVATLITDGAVLTTWLRDVEAHLAREPYALRDPAPPVAAVLDGVLPALADAYLGATDDQRSATRLAFSRFRRVLHRLSTCAARQLPAVAGPAPNQAVQRALALESMLDMRLDWRDELLLLRDLRRRADAAGVPFAALVHQAAACSSPRTAAFLRGVLGDQ